MHVILRRAAVVPLPGVVLLRFQLFHSRQLLGAEAVVDDAVSGEEFLQVLPESGQVHIRGQEFPDVADAAADGLGRLGLELGGIYIQRPRHRAGVGVEQQRAVVQDSAMAHPLGGAGYLASLHQNVIPAGGLGIEAQALQRLHHLRGKPLHGQLLKLSGVGDEGVIQVAQIVVHGAAAGGPADHVDMMLLYKGTVNLRLGVLILQTQDWNTDSGNLFPDKKPFVSAPFSVFLSSFSGNSRSAPILGMAQAVCRPSGTLFLIILQSPAVCIGFFC